MATFTEEPVLISISRGRIKVTGGTVTPKICMEIVPNSKDMVEIRPIEYIVTIEEGADEFCFGGATRTVGPGESLVVAGEKRVDLMKLRPVVGVQAVRVRNTTGQ